ncbi:MAG: hypothetical protein NC489_32175 [Ruminococcus flavefaciens]|nr:hypothetical protein [Ruminococcus flavefaciens]
MGLIYNSNVEEAKIYQAYSLTVYGKINRYEWEVFDRDTENALITIRITDKNNIDIFTMYMGNNCILQSRIDDTMDNFLFWIVENKPDKYDIETQIYKSLCASDSLFNNKIKQQKLKKQKEIEEKARIAEREALRADNNDKIMAYCNKKGLFPYFTYDYVYFIKIYNENVKSLFKKADNKQMDSYINFILRNPENKDACIIKRGYIENVLKDIETEAR